MELNKDFNLQVGLRIREYREFLHLTREQFSEKCDISSSFLSSVEGGHKAITSKTIYKICSAYHISADYLIMGRDSAGETDLILDMVHSLPAEGRPFAIQILRNYIEGIQAMKK